MPRLRRRSTGGQYGPIYRDDSPVVYGGVADLEWSTNDANANVLLIDFPAGGATDVPVLALSISDADFGFWNGTTQPTLGIIDVAGTSFVSLSFSANAAAALAVGGSASSLSITAATVNVAAATLATIYGAGTQIGFDSGAYMKFAVADTTGAVTITHAGNSKAIGWTSTGGLTFTGAFEVVGATTLDALTTAGNLSVDATTALIDGATSVRNVSAGFNSLESPANRFGSDATWYMQVATTATSGITAITHTGSAPAVTWTATSLSFVGNFDANGATVSLDGSTSVRGISAGFTSLESSANRFGSDATYYMQIATTTSTGVTAITHTGSGPTVTWTANSFDFVGTMALDATTLSDDLTLGSAKDIIISGNTAASLEINDSTTKLLAFDTRNTVSGVEVIALTPGAATLPDGASSTRNGVVVKSSTTTLVGTTQVTTAFDGLSFQVEVPTIAQSGGAVTVDKASTVYIAGPPTAGGSVTITAGYALDVVGAASFTGNMAVDGTTVLFDGSTSARNVSAGVVSSEAPDIRFGFSDSIYTKFAVADTTGNLTITHVGGSTDLVTWTAAGGFSLVGNVAVTGTFGASGTLSVGLDATAGTLELYPGTTNKGTTTLTMSDNTGDTITNIAVAAQAGVRVYTLPDAGASANVVLMTSSQAVAGTLTRADLTEEALAVYGVPLALVRQEDGIPLAVAETGGTFNLIVSSDIWYLMGEISQGETETSESCFQFILPPEYVAAGDVKVRIKNRCVLGSGTNNGSTLDVEVFEQTGNGAIGSDLVSTGAQTYAATSAWQTTDFVVDGTGLVAGDILNVVVTASVVESGSSNPIHVELDGLAMLLDIKG